MEDTEEMDTDDIVVMEDIISLPPIDEEDEETYDNDNNNYPSATTAGLTAIGAEGLFRAGTPTPVITPPFPQITVPPTHVAGHEIVNTSNTTFANQFQDVVDGSGMEMFEALPLMMSDNIFDGVMEEALNAIDDYAEINHEIPIDELDTECTKLSLSEI